MACLRREYGLQVISLRFLPIGYDFQSAVYEATTEGGAAYFLKLRTGPLNLPGLRVARALMDHGIPNVVGPLRTVTHDLSCSLGDCSVILYPFIQGKNAKEARMTEGQWREFGAALKAIHGSGLASRFLGQIPQETFALPSAKLVRELQSLVMNSRPFDSPAQRELASFWKDHSEEIRQIADRAEALGKRLQTMSFEYVLCHADIHAANVMLGEGGNVYLVDWDGPLIAPRERDLLFIVGSVIARPVEPVEEAWFFQTYGNVKVNPAALAYYRFERALEDIGEGGKAVFWNSDFSEAARRDETNQVFRLFQPGNIVESALEADSRLDK